LKQFDESVCGKFYKMEKVHGKGPEINFFLCGECSGDIHGHCARCDCFVKADVSLVHLDKWPIGAMTCYSTTDCDNRIATKQRAKDVIEQRYCLKPRNKKGK
jgi:hypothetical protein